MLCSLAILFSSYEHILFEELLLSERIFCFLVQKIRIITTNSKKEKPFITPDLCSAFNAASQVDSGIEPLGLICF